MLEIIGKQLTGLLARILKYFDNFNTYFQDSLELQMLNTYRCGKSIVEYANKINIDSSSKTKSVSNKVSEVIQINTNSIKLNTSSSIYFNKVKKLMINIYLVNVLNLIQARMIFLNI